MDVKKIIALDRATADDLALWLAQYIKKEFEKYPQTRAPVLPRWEPQPTTEMAQSSWGVGIRDTPYAGWEHFDPPVMVTESGKFLSTPLRIALRVEVFDKGLVIAGVCKDNQSLGFFAELMKAMEDTWPRVDDSRDASRSSSPENREGFRLEVPDSTDSIKPIAAQAERVEDALKRWENSPVEGWNRKAVELWRAGHTAREIARMIDRDLMPKTILNVISSLRGIYGTEVVPERRSKSRPGKKLG